MKLVIVLIVLVSALMVTIWFREGYIMGTAEDSLIFYNISRFLPESQFAWMEHPGLGRVTINLTAARPTYEMLTFLHNLDVPNFLIQALTIWFILVSAGIGIYLIVKEFFPQLPNRYAFISVLFYWFNPLSLVNVWNRFLSNYIVSFGLFPIAAFLFIRGLNKRNYLWSFVLVLILPIYSFAFTYIAFDFILWIFFFLVTLFFLLAPKESNYRLFYIKYFFLTFLLFLITNFWWIGQLTSLNLYNNIDSSVLNFDISVNAGTLDALSKKMGNLSDIFRFMNVSFLNENSLSWMKTFYSLPFIIIQFLFAFIILFSIAKNIKNRSVLILSGLFFVSIYLVKGTNPPFGEIYQFIFTNIPFFQIFRNPFEKAAPVLFLSASLLIGFSIFSLLQQFPRRLTNLIYIIFLILIAIVWGSPFYTGLVFTSPDPPTNNYQIGYKVKVPAYYQEADQWLISQGNNFRFIGFPLGDEGITYNWEKGYSGVELSSALFATPGILHRTAIPYFTELVPQIQEILLSQNDFIKLANSLNVRFFFVRHDINFERRKMRDPTVIDNNLTVREKSNEIKKVATFGQLTFWENLKWQDYTFYSATNIVKSSKNQQVSELLNIDVNKGDVLIDGRHDPSLSNADKIIEVSYRKINPARYVVNIKNTGPFVLVFSELYNDAWQANHQNTIFKHLRANFYANGWLIDKTGDFSIDIEYLPQNLLDLGEKISLISYFFAILIFTLLVFRNIKAKRILK